MSDRPTTAQRVHIEYLGSRIYWVSSRSQPGAFHLVDLNHHTCTCPAYTKGHYQTCHHRTLAGQVECARGKVAQDVARQQAARQPVAGSLEEAFGAIAPAERLMNAS